MNNFDEISMLQIELFLSVANSRSITSAAKRLYISQSAATRLIQKFESCMNTTLFERTNQGVKLTDSGRDLYRQLKPSYSRLNTVFYNAYMADSGSDKLIRVACMDSNEIFDELSPIIKQYQNIFPECDIDMKLCSFQELREGVLSGRFDCAFTFSVSSKDLPKVELRYYKHMDTFFAVSASSPAVEGGLLNYSKLAESYMFIQPRSKYDMTALRDLSVCRSHGFSPKGIQYISGQPAVEAMVHDTTGFSVCGPGFGLEYPNDILLFRTEKPLEEEQYITVIWRPEDCSEEARRFVEFVPCLKKERMEK